MDIINDIKAKFKSSNIVYQLIFINVAVFIFVGIINMIAFLSNANFSTEAWLAVPANLNTLMFRPWTLISYMFLHYDIFHILFNMLWLFWFGDLFINFIDPKKILSVYILGGLSGAILYILAYNLIPVFTPLASVSIALGASASVYAIVIAVCAYIPDYSIGLLFIGRVKLKYLALVIVIIDLLSISGSNAGGHISHLGGALFGFIFALQLKKGNDITKWFGRLTYYLRSLFRKTPKMKVSYNNNIEDVKYTETKQKPQPTGNTIDKKLQIKQK